MKESGTGYRHYVLGVLLLAYLVNSLDRSILSLLIEPIRLEFGLSDTQLGVLSGLAFALFYSALAIPIAALADRWNRRNVLALAVLLWTLMTALCGWAGSFVALLMARIGVAIGEAGCNPASHSLLADYFAPQRRATALGIFALGAPAGALITGLVGGWGSENFGWRGTMMLAATPGLLLVPLLLLTVREPRRPVQPMPAVPGAARPSLPSTLAHLWSQASFRHLCLASALHSFAMYGASSFNPAYLSRSHGWTGGEVGELIALTGLAGLAGGLFGGIATDRLSAGRMEPRWQLWAPGIATLLAIPVQIVAYLGSGTAMTASLLLSSALSLVFFGPSYAAAQSLAAPRMRAVAASILLFSKALVGMGLGPLMVGVLSDRLAPALGQDSLRWALLLVPAFNAWAGWHFFIAARHLRQDLQRLAVRSHDLPLAEPAPFG